MPSHTCRLKVGGLFLAAALLGSAQIQKTQPTESTNLINSIQGPALYSAYCAVCHGSDLKGGGPMAKSLRVQPSDLTRIASRNRGTFPFARIERIISGQDSLQAGHGTREMPVWGPIFSQIAWDQDLGRVRVNNVARYLQKMQAR